MAIRKGDILISQGKPYEVFVFIFKRREFHACPIWEGQSKNISKEQNIIMPVNGLKEKGYATAYIPQPAEDERKLIQAIHTGHFYNHPDKRLKEKHYRLHLVCATYNEYQPPIFSIGDEGKLAIKEDRYYAYKDPDTIHALNPFSPDDMAIIKTAAQNGIVPEYAWRMETYYELFQDCVPELAALIVQAMLQDEADMAESA
jgi:hypothetical protein